MARINLTEVAGEIEDHEIEVAPGRVFRATGDLPLAALIELRKTWQSGMFDLTSEEAAEETMALLGRFLELVFGAENAGQLLQILGPRRFPALMQVLVTLYGLDKGEAGASSSSSPSTGNRSRPTSSASTGSTSGTPASAPAPSEPEFVASPV